MNIIKNTLARLRSWLKRTPENSSSPASAKRTGVFAPGETTDLDITLFLRINTQKIIDSFDLCEADIDDCERIVRGFDSPYSACLEMIEKEQAIPTRYWLIVLFSAQRQWDNTTSYALENHYMIFQLDDGASQGIEKTTINALFEILIMLKRCEEGEGSLGDEDNLCLIRCADQLAEYFPAEANDIYSAGFNMLPQLASLIDGHRVTPEALLASAERYMDVTKQGGKREQIASASVTLASALALCAAQDDKYRNRSLLVFEQACERISWLPQPLVYALADRLYTVVRKHQFLQAAARRLADYMDESTQEQIKQAINLPRLVPTIDSVAKQAADVAQWVHDVKAMAAMDARLDDNLLAHRLNRIEYQYSFNISSDWRINHASYMNAIPHNRSFFREQNYKHNLTALIHEVTHLLSLRGGVGMTAISLRAALVVCEYRLMAKNLIKMGRMDVSEADLKLAGLTPNRLAHLPEVATELALMSKLRALYRVWMPILEGVAMYAELDADPMEDEEEFATVHQILFGLTDNFRTEDADGQNDSTEDINREEILLANLSAYEEKASEAMRHCRAESLRTGLDHTNEAYWVGYLTIRSIVRGWRDNLGEQDELTAARSLKLLMIALTSGTIKFIPRLDLAPGDFETRAEELMHAWCESVARLSRESIATGISRVTSSPRHDHIWLTDSDLRSRVMASTPESRSALERELAEFEENITDQALAPAKLSVESGTEPISEDSAFALALDKIMADNQASSLDENKSRLKDICTSQTQQLLQLEIGSTKSRFYMKPYSEDAVSGYIYVNLRTTEKHIETGDSSYNGMVIPLDQSEFQEISRLYEKYREPRITIRRFVDILGTVSPTGLYPHFLVFSYGDDGEFTHLVRGASPFAEACIENSPEDFEYLRTILAGRITPDASGSLELALTDDSALAQRALRWLVNSDCWEVEGKVLMDIKNSAMVSRLVSTAESICDTDAQVHRANSVARRLAARSIGFPDQGPTNNLNSFRRAIGPTAVYRTARAIIDTGCAPDDNDELHALNAKLDSIPTSLFSPTATGMDVVAFQNGRKA